MGEGPSPPGRAQSNRRARKRLRRVATLAVRQALAVVRGAARIVVHGKRNQQRASLRREKSLTLRERRVPRICDSRQQGRGKSLTNGNESSRVLPAST